MTSKIRWALVGLGIVGAVMNAFGLRESFMVWTIANAGMLLLNTYTKHYPEALLFGVYLVTAVFGWLCWGGLL